MLTTSALANPPSDNEDDWLSDAPIRTLLKELTWRAANTCLLAGLLTWPLERRWVRIEQHTMPVANLGQEFDGLRIAHLSDLHSGMLVREKHLHRYIELVNDMDVDFAVLTGDFLTTASRKHADAVARVLGDLKVRRGKLACLGNHDYGLWHPRRSREDRDVADYLSDGLARAGVIVLRNASRAFFIGESVLQFVGIDDYWSPQCDPQGAFELVDHDWPVIALAHNPDSAPDLAGRGAAWVLAGHTHGEATPDSRLWDAVYPTRFKQFVGGAYALPHGASLYVNRGLSNRLRLRREHRPEITLLTLRATGPRRPVARHPMRNATDPACLDLWAGSDAGREFEEMLL